MSRKKYSLVKDLPPPVDNGPASSTKEAKAITEFKARVKDITKPEHDDHYLTKWLKARNYDIAKAEEMFRTSMTYRSQIGIDRLVLEYRIPEVLEKYLAGGFCGYDKEGSPVLIELYGHNDMKGILHSAKRSDIEKTKLLLGEQVMKMLADQSRKLNRNVDGMTVVIDMDNVGAWMFWGPGIQMYAHMGRVLQDNYPEIVKRTFIVNAPRIFPMLWKMFRPLVTEEMKSKVQILGGNFQDELRKYIPDDQLPEFLGGILRDPDGDPRCPSKICQGGTVPEEYYRTELTSTEGFTKVSIANGDKLKEKIEVSVAGSIIRWEFKTDGYDIGFGLQFEDDDGPEELLPVERVNSHMVPEDGTYDCARPGVYVIIFDNSYSWARAKTLLYNIDVVAPDDAVTHDLDKVTQGGSWCKISNETCMTRL